VNANPGSTVKTIFKLLVVGIACATTAIPQLCEAEPTLKDFGYGTMRTDRTLYLAVILVNFTNAPVPDKVAVPYLMGANQVGTNYSAAERYYTNWFLAVNGSTNPTVNGYLHEASNGRMGCRLAGLTMLTLDTNLNYSAVAARLGGGGPAADRIYASNFLWLAASKANFATVTNRDLDHSTTITDDECALVLLSNDKTIGGGTRGPYLLPLPKTSIRWFTKFTFQAVDDTPLAVVNHEILHVMQGGHSRDIYGPDGTLSYAFTIMSGGREITHPDPWHKLQLAWCEPRIHSMREAGLLTLPAAQLMRDDAPVVLYDPADSDRNIKEFFILEYRSRTNSSAGRGYDWQVGGNGLVIWQVRQNSNKNPIEYTQTYYPNSETTWRQCKHCQGLFFADGTDRPCPSAHSVHEAEDSHICLPYNDPSVEGVPGWRWCKKCSQLFYLPNLANSVCAAGGLHLSGTGEYRLRQDSDPESLGTRGWWHCGKCQCLVRDAGVCPDGGRHVIASGTSTFTLFWWQDLVAIMNAGSPDLARGRGGAWDGGSITPLLRYYDGEESRTRLAVHPFQPGADAITVEVQPNYDAWVDFVYGGAEDGSFTRPFNTFAEGVNEVYSGGILHLKAGTSSETRHVTKPMRIESYGGAATLGRQ
jgi:M6 family metalloprotease-like protein